MGIFDIFKVNQYKKEIETLKAQNSELNQKLNNLGFDTYEQSKHTIDELQHKYEAQQQQFNNTVTSNEAVIIRLQDEINRMTAERNQLNEQIANDREKSEKQLKSANNKLSRNKELYKSIEFLPMLILLRSLNRPTFR